MSPERTDTDLEQQEEPALVAQVRRLRVDCILGKKKHFNAADRKHFRVVFLRWAPIVISLVLASAFFFKIQQYAPAGTQWLGTLLALLAALVSWGDTAYSNVPADHRRVAEEYLNIQKQCDDLLSAHRDGVVDLAGVNSTLTWLREKYRYINSEANKYPTNRTDFEQARQGLQSGEEDYLENELDG